MGLPLPPPGPACQLDYELSQREMASMLYVSINTVKTPTRAIHRKLDVTSRTQAVAAARALGLI